MIKALITTAMTICLCACGDPGKITDTTPAAAQNSAVSIQAAQLHPTTRQMALWARSCALCHVDGNAGAPRIGQASDWDKITTTDPDMLVENVIAGINDMPPLGYCMACEREDLHALVQFMLASQESQESQEEAR